MDKAAIFKKFVETNEFLIVDKNPGSRNRLMKTLIDLGGKRHMIHTSSNIEEATQVIQTRKLGMVLSDYVIMGGSGFDLFKIVRNTLPQTKDICLLLVTSNNSQTAVAKAAEEDVDSFVLKPYTVQSLQESLINTVVNKIQPSDYVKKIDEGKLFIKDKKFDEAIAILQEARKLHSKPSLALFYLGQAEYLKSQWDVATGSYKEGISFNSIHFKCLVGLFDIFMEDKQYFEAYGVVKKIAKYFPANPDRLAQIVHLAMRTSNYMDMQFYYEIFTTLDVRAPELTKYVGAGMFIAGKVALLEGKRDEAFKYFNNIAVTCSEFTLCLRAVITTLVEKGEVDEAKKYLERFDSSTKELSDYQISNYRVTSCVNKDPGHIVKHGLDLYNKSIKDLGCLEVLVTAMVESGYKDDKILPFRQEIELLKQA